MVSDLWFHVGGFRFRIWGSRFSRFGVSGAGFRGSGFFVVLGLTFEVWGSGFRGRGFGFCIGISGFRIWGSWFGVSGAGFGFRVRGLDLGVGSLEFGIFHG